MNSNYERMFTAKDIIKYVLKRYKKILVLFIIGVIGGCGYGFASKKIYVSSTNKEKLKIQLASIREQIGDNEANQAENAFKTYNSLMSQKSSVQNIVDSSIYINLNPNSSKKLTVTYLLSNTKNADSIANSIQALLVDEKLFNSVKNNLNQNITFTQFKSLISIYSGNSSNDVNVNFDAGDTSNSTDLVITIVDQNTEQVNVISRELNTRIKNISSNLIKNYGSFKLIKGDQSYGNVTEDEITSLQNGYTTELANITGAISSLTNTLSSDQQTYLQTLNKLSKIKNEKSSFSFNVLFNYMFIAGISLVILYICFLIVSYIMSDELRKDEEAKNAFNKSIIYSGTYNSKIITNELYYEKSINKNSNIAITSSNTNFEDFKNLANQCNDVLVINNRPENKDEFDQLLEVQKIVLVEKCNLSKMKDIKNTIEYYQAKGKTIEGIIVLS